VKLFVPGFEKQHDNCDFTCGYRITLLGGGAAARPLGRLRRARSSARYLVTSTSQATQIIMEHSGALFDIDETKNNVVTLYRY
jgi:hypothetical protein